MSTCASSLVPVDGRQSPRHGAVTRGKSTARFGVLRNRPAITARTTLHRRRREDRTTRSSTSGGVPSSDPFCAASFRADRRIRGGVLKERTPYFVSRHGRPSEWRPPLAATAANFSVTVLVEHAEPAKGLLTGWTAAVERGQPSEGLKRARRLDSNTGRPRADRAARLLRWAGHSGYVRRPRESRPCGTSASANHLCGGVQLGAPTG